MEFVTTFALLSLLSFAQTGDGTKADATTFKPTFNPELSLTRLEGSIVIDGDLTDEGWKSASKAESFTEHWPKSLEEPGVETEAWLTYDEDHFYIAIRAEGKVDEIRATLRDRDEIWSDDYVGILLDTYASGNWYYEFFVNPLGVQGDLIATQNNEDGGADFIFESEGRITDTGYQVEIAIPFSNLRFPEAEEQIWKMTIWRDHKSNDRKRYTWAAIDRDNACFPCQFGTIRGIRNISRPSSIDILPSFVANQSSQLDNNDRMQNNDILGDIGFTAKYQATPELVAEFTYNPDFSQIESDASQIDVNSTFALFYDERRPFFQEGSDIFLTPSNVVYTRRINAPDFAGKITGRTDKLSYVYLIARDEYSPLIVPGEESSDFLQNGKSLANIGRMKYSFGNGSSVGGIITDRRYDQDGSNTVAGIDGNYRFGDSYNLTSQFLFSHTKEQTDPILNDQFNNPDRKFGKYSVLFDGEEFDGSGGLIRLDRYTKNYSFETQYSQVTSAFRADNGFINQTDLQEFWFWNAYSFYPESGIINQIRPGFVAGQNWNMAGVSKDEFIRPQLYIDFKAQTWLNIQYLWNNERFRDQFFGQINRWFFSAGSQYFSWMSVELYGNYGHQIARGPLKKGRGGSAGFWISFKPTDQLIVEPGWDYFTLRDAKTDDLFFDGYILRTRVKYQFTRELSARAIFEYDKFGDSFSIEPLVSYKLNPFSVFYAGATSNHSYFPNQEEYRQTGRQYFVKFQFLFGV